MVLVALEVAFFHTGSSSGLPLLVPVQKPPPGLLTAIICSRTNLHGLHSTLFKILCKLLDQTLVRLSIRNAVFSFTGIEKYSVLAHWE